MSMRAGTGMSFEIDEPFTAGKDAAEAALAELDGRSPNLILLFAAIDFDHTKLLEGVRSVTGDAPLIGCTTDGELSDGEGVTDDSAVLMAMQSDDLQFEVAVGEGLDKDPTAAARHVARIANKRTENGRIMICLPDCSMTGGGTAVIHGLQEVLGADFPIVGGAPGDGRKLTGTFQFCGDRVLQHAMPVAYIEGPMRFGSGVRSGLHPLGKKAVCTKADGSLVLEIDGKPAIEHHREYVGDSLTVPATIANFPYILLEETNKMATNAYFVARTNFFYDEDTGAIQCSAPIPEGAQIKIARASRDDILAGARESAAQTKEMYGEGVPSALLVISCSGRKQVLGIEVDKEIAAIQDVFGTRIPTIGFYSYGEFGPLKMGTGALGACSYHSYTMSMFALG